MSAHGQANQLILKKNCLMTHYESFNSTRHIVTVREQADDCFILFALVKGCTN